MTGHTPRRPADNIAADYSRYIPPSTSDRPDPTKFQTKFPRRPVDYIAADYSRYISPSTSDRPDSTKFQTMLLCAGVENS